jgi:elongation factor 1-gamma
LRKHALGVIGVYGDEPNLEIKGVFIFRGIEIPEPMAKEHPQFEFFSTRKLDVTKEEDRKLAEEYFDTKEEGTVEGLTVQTYKLYK